MQSRFIVDVDLCLAKKAAGKYWYPRELKSARFCHNKRRQGHFSGIKFHLSEHSLMPVSSISQRRGFTNLKDSKIESIWNLNGPIKEGEMSIVPVDSEGYCAAHFRIISQ